MSKGAPAMDLSYLLDEIMVGVTPLDWERTIARCAPCRGSRGCVKGLRAAALLAACSRCTAS